MIPADQKRPFYKALVTGIVTKMHALLTSGMTPKKLAFTLCFGTALGIMPLLWGTSLICFLLAHLFRLNHITLQSVNYLLYPLQLVLLVPFFKLGTWLLPWGVPVTPDKIYNLLQNPGAAGHMLVWIMIKSVAAWMLTALPLALLIYTYTVLLLKLRKPALCPDRQPHRLSL